MFNNMDPLILVSWFVPGTGNGAFVSACGGYYDLPYNVTVLPITVTYFGMKLYQNSTDMID